MFDFRTLQGTLSRLPVSVKPPAMPIDEELGSIGQTGYYEGWTECADALRERDEDNVKAMSDELDAFLAF
ncbi:hypothetical protein BD311DRAFT_699622, partial [Dichomitus squalens]